MIAPTPRAIALVGIAAPAALLLGLYRPDLWFAAAAWVGFCLALIAIDALIGSPLGSARLALTAPQAVGVGEPFPVTATVARRGAGPHSPRLSLAVDQRLSRTGRIDATLVPASDGLRADLTLTALRRGLAGIAAAWIGWTGPLGLARKQKRVPLGTRIVVAPSIRAVREDGVRLFARDAQIGQRLNARLGEGSEFESLVRFMPGLDRRAIDWKQSARHTDLLAKQYETERDNRIMLVIDAGRMMSEPVVGADGLHEPRLDRAVSAALTLGYVALRLEDRVSLASFAAGARVDPREYSRLGDFAALRRAAAEIDYSSDDSNFTLGLAQVGAALKRRALIVVFTEFADAAGAELMLRAAERLTAKHLLLFVVTADSELERIAAHPPEDADAMTGATIAADLLRDRRVVLARLRRMGVLIVEAPAAGLSSALLDSYIRIKRRGRI